MNKVIVLTLGVVLLSAGFAFAQQTPPASQTAVQTMEVSNKHCPVSGREIGLMGPAFKLEYNSKVYNLCCPGCQKTFNSDHGKYSKIAEDEVKAAKK